MTTAREILEEAGLTQTHWGQRIIKAEEAGGFTEGDKRASKSWTTCACGRLDDGIPRVEGGAPKDIDLWELGSEFYNLVCAERGVRAAETLVAIEKRAIEVLRGDIAPPSEVEEISCDAYTEALEEFPPADHCGGGGASSFYSIEAAGPNRWTHYVSIRKEGERKYYRFDSTGTPHEERIAKVEAYVL